MNVDKKDKIIYSIIALLVIGVYIPLPCLTYNFYFFERMYNFLQLMCGIVIILLYIRRGKISKMMLTIIVFYGIYFISTIMHNQFKMIVFRIIFSAISLCAFSEMFIKFNKKIFFKIAYFYLALIAFMNFITIILFPNGLYETDNINPYYLLGHRNNSIEYILPAIFFCYISFYENKNRLKKNIYFISLISCLTVILTWSGNAIVALFIVLLYSIFPTKKLLEKFIGFKGFFTTSLGLFILFIIMKVQYVFSWFITKVLHKSIDFTGRVDIWDNALHYIEKSPIIGYGYENPDLKLKKIGHSNSAHNYYLDFLYNGGIIMLILYFYMIFLLNKVMNQVKNRDLKNIFIAITAGYFIVGFATPIHMETLSYMFMIFTIIYNFKDIEK